MPKLPAPNALKPQPKRPGTETNGKVTPISLTPAQILESHALANSLTSQGWSPGLCYLVSHRA